MIFAYNRKPSIKTALIVFNYEMHLQQNNIINVKNMLKNEITSRQYVTILYPLPNKGIRSVTRRGNLLFIAYRIYIDLFQ